MYIRAYKRADWPHLCRIHDAARMMELRLSAGEAAFLTLEQAAHNEDLFANHVDVGLTDDGIVGFAAYSSNELTWLYVDPICHGKGYGRALLRHAMGRSGPVFGTQVLVGNDPAIALYQSEGFIIRERRDGQLTGNEAFAASGLIMEWRR